MTNRRVIAAGAGALVLVAALVAALALGGGADGRAAPGSRLEGSTTVERRDLATHDDVDGTLGYGDPEATPAGADGTVTWLPEKGAVVEPGGVLYRVDGEPVVALDGTEPAWRDLEEGIAAGADVRQLERNLVRLGFDPQRVILVDGTFDFATRAAVQRWQHSLGLEETGIVEVGRVVFLDGARRVAQLAASVGGLVTRGAEVLSTTPTRRVVTVDLDAADRALVKLAQRVDVELPDGGLAEGVISEISRVAEVEEAQDGSEAEPTIGVTIRLLGGAGGAYDEAPVTVRLVTEAKRGVLAVPVTALIAIPGGRYALDAGGRRLQVDTGLFADGYVEVSGSGVKEGLRVADAAPE